MIQLSIQARQAPARLILPVLFIASFGLILLGKADTMLAERARITLADGLVPIYAALSAPVGRIHAGINEAAALWAMREEIIVWPRKSRSCDDVGTRTSSYGFLTARDFE